MESNAISPYAEVALDALAPSPTNPRKTFADLEDLAASIREQGVMQPILTRLWPDHYPTPEGRDSRPLYEIVAGERRYRASLLAGLATIPALVRPLTTRQVLEAQIVENLQRRDVTELEEAEGYQLMMRDHGYSADDLADKVGKSRAYIYARLKLTALCLEARQFYRDGKLDASRALLIARIPVPALQVQAAKEIIREGHFEGPMSARQAAAHIQHRYMLDLAKAPFGRDAHYVITVEASLAGKGPLGLVTCVECPKRTGNDPEAYPGIHPDVCTDPNCYADKRAAHLAQAAARAGGRTQGHHRRGGEEDRPAWHLRPHRRQLCGPGREGLLRRSLPDRTQSDQRAGRADRDDRGPPQGHARTDGGQAGSGRGAEGRRYPAEQEQAEPTRARAREGAQGRETVPACAVRRASRGHADAAERRHHAQARPQPGRSGADRPPVLCRTRERDQQDPRAHVRPRRPRARARGFRVPGRGLPPLPAADRDDRRGQCAAAHAAAARSGAGEHPGRAHVHGRYRHAGAPGRCGRAGRAERRQDSGIDGGPARGGENSAYPSSSCAGGRVLGAEVRGWPAREDPARRLLGQRHPDQCR
ncbi:MAG: ParB/RepB/Spo0J family partition protein [Thauera sp.]|nr:ParB/RepB/Spo0J family partition protein [Thauera sp.]